MKILKICLKNLNSLVSDSPLVIDFTGPEFVNGLFAITGPTGAGKTTLFDAVCLALYGCTPRLGKITQTSNEIMSRGTMECSSVVYFSADGGQKIYRCLWSQSRSRGNLQPVKRLLTLVANPDATEGEILADKLTSVQDEVEKLIHMDFNQFTRAVLLAQGNFDSFLRADDNDRRKILESITGTELYSQISKNVFERFRDEKKAFEALKSQQDSLKILTSEQMAKLSKNLEDTKAEIAALNVKIDATRKCQVWVSDLKKLEAEYAALEQECMKLNLELEKFKPERQKLADSERAASLAGDYGILQERRKLLVETQREYNKCVAQEPTLETNATQTAEAHVQAEDDCKQARQRLEDAAEDLKLARNLDQSIQELSRNFTKAKESFDAGKDELAKQQIQLKACTGENTKISRAIEQLESGSEELKKYAELPEKISGIEQRIEMLISKNDDLASLRERYSKAHADLTSAQKAFDLTKKNLARLEQEFATAQAKRDKKQSELDKLLAGKEPQDYQAERDAAQLKLVKQQKIQGYEAERSRLSPDEPCPLCGSVHHPFIDDNATLELPEPSETENEVQRLTELIKAIEKRQADVRKLETDVNSANLKLTQGKGEVANAKLNLENVQKVREEIIDEGKRTGESERVARNALFSELEPFGIFELGLETGKKDIRDSLERLRESLRKKCQDYQEFDKKCQNYNERSGEIKLKLASLEAEVNGLQKNVEERTRQVDGIKAELDEKEKARANVLNGQNADNFEKKLTAAVKQAEERERQTRTVADNAGSELKVARANLRKLEEQLQSHNGDLVKYESAFNASLIKANFENESAFLAARLEPAEMERLKNEDKRLMNWGASLNGRQRDCNQRLTQKRDEHPELVNETTNNLEARFHEEFNAEEKKLKGLNETQGQLNADVRYYEKTKEDFDKLQEKIDRQKPEFEHWDDLNDLIGSADGKKYSSFAQQVTLDLLVAHANRHLAKMGSRYMLDRKDEKEENKRNDTLGLEVIDSEQGGERRPTSNLSGGESFMVSLALALGLSQMNGQKTTVESLFLDEGFGSLDEESLDMALAALSSMQQENRMIGIISHVEALKERIPTQIEVRPTSGGHSEIILPRKTVLKQGDLD